MHGDPQALTGARAHSTMSFPAEADRRLVELLRGLPEVPRGVSEPVEELFTRAEVHGLAGVLSDAWRAAGHSLPGALEAELHARAAARELDHAARLALLARIGAALGAAEVPAVSLKGPLFAERFYARPAARGTSDVDLLVEEARLEDARRALSAVGYRSGDAARDGEARREHHHIVLTHPSAPPLELHFCAYVGFGERLASEPLIARAQTAGPRFADIRTLSAPDELVYLAVHAAAHRFGRLAWLHDLRLLLATMTERETELAAVRAREHGYARPLALAAALLVDVFGVPRGRVATLGSLDRLRAPLVRAFVGEPRPALLRSATRFAYTVLLGQSAASSLRYARSASLRHASSLLPRRRR